MPVNLHTRKPVVKLTSTDLRAFPVWEYASDEEGTGGQDETWVRPVDSSVIRKGEYSQIVATDFQTVSGKSLQGFMVVTTAEKPVDITPGAVIGKFGYANLPWLSRSDALKKNAPWQVETRESLLASLRETENQVFPIQYYLRVHIHGEKEKRHGTIA